MDDELNNIRLELNELHNKVAWLENRYQQTMKIIADTVASVLPLDLQQKFYLDIVKRMKAIEDADLTRKN